MLLSLIVKDFPNYSIDRLGTITNIKTNRQLKYSTASAGYNQLCLYNKGEGSKLYQHRLIATHFMDNPNKYLVINHKNGDKKDNRIENLEWCTQGHNNQSKNKNTNIGCVYRHKTNNLFYATIVIYGVKYYKSSFKTEEDAREWCLNLSNQIE